MSALFLASATHVSAVGPLTGVATNEIATGGDYTLKVAVSQLTGNIRLGIEDSPDGTNWTPLAAFDFTASTSTTNEVDVHDRSYDAPGLVVTGSAQARINVYKLTAGATATVTSLINY